MEWTQIIMLVAAGGVAGFVAGLIGVGGGIIFTPVLALFFASLGVGDALIPKLAIGSGLFCTLIAAVVSAWAQHQRGAVDRRMMMSVGLAAAVPIGLMVAFVTTKPWYDATVFQVVFAAVLLFVVGRMVRQALAARRAASHAEGAAPHAADPVRRGVPLLAGTGAVAGVVSSAVGVGGGVVLVPAYHAGLRLPIHRAVGTSSATIVLISTVGVVTYAVMGWGVETGIPGAVGYVDVPHAALLSLPALLTARLGVAAAHRFNTAWLRLAFASLAGLVAARLLWNAIA
jgi:hypothetical protein